MLILLVGSGASPWVCTGKIRSHAKPPGRRDDLALALQPGPHSRGMLALMILWLLILLPEELE